MSYRATVLEERMLLAALKRRRNELRDDGKPPSAHWIPLPPTNHHHVSTAERGSSNSARADYSRRQDGQSMIIAGGKDPWAESLSAHRDIEQGRVSYYTRGSQQLSEAQRPWLERRSHGSARVPRAEELEGVHFFLTHARRHMTKRPEQGMGEITHALESHAQRGRISKGWAATVRRSHRDMLCTAKLRDREEVREADRRMKERALERRRVVVAESAAVVEAARRATAESAFLMSSQADVDSPRAVSPPAFTIVPL
jgi:hypothetical protein